MSHALPRLLPAVVALAGWMIPVPGASAESDVSPSKTKSDWAVTVGGGVAVMPKYEGGKKLHAAPVPIASVVWRQRVFVDGLRAGAYAVNNGRFRLGASVGYGGERREKDGSRLNGMGKVKSAVQPQLEVAYTMGPVTFASSLTRDLGGSKGTTAVIGAQLSVPVGPRLSINAGTSATWADANHMKTNFGVSPEQAKRSGNRTFHAASGFKKVDVALGARYAVTDHWAALTRVGVSTLIGDAGKSPVVERKTSIQSMAGVAYTF